jgi:hypothetical protein
MQLVDMKGRTEKSGVGGELRSTAAEPTRGISSLTIPSSLYFSPAYNYDVQSYTAATARSKSDRD